jgi:redox-sensitive bicupin YhaK (pirin superfamily)
MSTIAITIPERAADIGNFMVGRLLPFRQKRAVGPFVFIDHMGPAHLKAGENLDVGPHPHIGLSTLTYLFEGKIMHRDSLGTQLVITPGAVNWMTAGKGIVHSERTPDDLRESEKTVHGLQIWVALPKELEEMEPSFTHIEAGELPTWETESVKFKLIAGTFGGYQSPVPVHSPLFLLELEAMETAELELGKYLFGESGIYILQGFIEQDGHRYGDRQVLIARESTICAFTLTKGSKVYLFGGESFPEERLLYWNFVSSDKSRLESAKERWRNGQFPQIPGEGEPVKMP